MRKEGTRLVLVEDSLSPVAKALRARGYTVRSFTEGDLGEADAVVVSGQDDHFAGISDVQTRAPVIRAEGRTPDEVVEDVDKQIRL